MAYKFLDSGHSAAAAVGYAEGGLDSDGKARPWPPEVLMGDTELFVHYCEGLPFKRQILPSVWSSPVLLPAAVERRGCHALHDCLAPGMAERVPLVAIKHRKADCSHIHLFAGRVDMQTGRHFTPYWDQADRPLFRALQVRMAQEEGLLDPRHPRVAAIVRPAPRRISAAAACLYGEVEDMVRQRVWDGHLVDRVGVMKCLRSQGYEIRAVSGSGIELFSPKYNIAMLFVGGAFAQRWRAGVGSARKRAADAAKWDADAPRRYREACMVFDWLRRRKATKLLDRYGPRHVALTSCHRPGASSMSFVSSPELYEPLNIALTSKENPCHDSFSKNETTGTHPTLQEPESSPEQSEFPMG